MRGIGTILRRYVPVVGLMLAALLAAACGGSNAPSSAVLLAGAGAKLAADQSFHFAMEEKNAGTISGEGYDILSAEGDVAQPDKMSAKAHVATALIPADVRLVVIGSQAWWTNPLTGSWERADTYANIRTVFGQGLAAIIASIENVGNPTDGSANGIPCWKITGTVSSDRLSALTGGQITAGQKVPLTVCIGKDDGQLRSVATNGKVAPWDNDQTTRTIYLSDFNKPVTIQPPIAS